MTLKNENKETQEVENKETVVDAKSIGIEMAKAFAEEIKNKKEEDKKEADKNIVDDKTIKAHSIKVVESDRPCGAFKNYHEMQVFADEYVPMNLLMQSNNKAAIVELQKALTTFGRISVDSDGGSLDPETANGILARSISTFPSYIEDTLNVPVVNSTATFIDNTSDVTALMIGETTAATESKAGFTTRTVTNKKIVSLAPVTGELIRFGTLANITSEVFNSMGRAISKKQQHLIFTADGDSDTNDGGITGVIQAMTDVVGNSSIFNVGGGGWNNLTTPQVSQIISQVASWGNSSNYAWYCHKNNWGEGLEALSRAISTNYLVSTSQAPVPQLHSYPVRFVDQMPSAYADGQIGLLFGDLSGVVATADFASTFVDSSKDFYFDQDVVVLRAIKHMGVEVFQPGTNGATTSVIAVRYQVS